MKYKFSDQWVIACPAEFQSEIAEHLNNPPGSPGAAKVYADTYEPDLTEEDFYVIEDHKNCLDSKAGKHLSAHEMEYRKKYSQAWGAYAESIVCCWLLERGYPIREKDWRPGGHSKPKKGEIDIITQKGDRIIFVEVKARYGKSNDPWDAINTQKIRRLCKGADTYLKMQRETFEYQFDIALVTGDPLDLDIEYIPDAFLAPLRSGR
ncbi:MAG: YraN family protein [Muribaculaceae bacterium]|nr:YraN family protein [Muribaculaceae bacterium]